MKKFPIEKDGCLITWLVGSLVAILVLLAIALGLAVTAGVAFLVYWFVHLLGLWAGLSGQTATLLAVIAAGLFVVLALLGGTRSSAAHK